MYVGISNGRACLLRTNELTKDNAMFALDGGVRPPKSEKVRVPACARRVGLQGAEVRRANG